MRPEWWFIAYLVFGYFVGLTLIGAHKRMHGKITHESVIPLSFIAGAIWPLTITYCVSVNYINMIARKRRSTPAKLDEDSAQS